MFPNPCTVPVRSLVGRLWVGGPAQTAQSCRGFPGHGRTAGQLLPAPPLSDGNQSAPYSRDPGYIWEHMQTFNKSLRNEPLKDQKIVERHLWREVDAILFDIVLNTK